MAYPRAQLPVLFGDSIFRRLLESHKSLFDPLSLRFCISGQRIGNLIGKVRDSRTELMGRSVIVLIGTNDILDRVSVEAISKSIRDLIRYLRRQKCQISICEILPIPRLGNLATPYSVVCEVNKYIRSFEPSGVKIIHTFNHFCTPLGIRVSLFCQTFGNSSRVDLVHPNVDGIECLLICLEV